MTTAVKAVYENWVFKRKEPVDLQEKTEVEVLIPTSGEDEDWSSESRDGCCTWWRRTIDE
jgi:predicted DNA-binding antitoxin AbrB/MazE fold protein